MNKLIDTEESYIFHSRETEGLRRHTLVGVVVKGVLKIGYAVASDGDTFTKALGRTIAHGRAIKTPTEELTIEGKTKPEVSDLFRKYAKSFPTMFKIKVEPMFYKQSKLKRYK